MNGRFPEALPEGMAMALAQNIYAMHHFSSLSEAEQQSVIERARTVGSREEMTALVNSLIRH